MHPLDDVQLYDLSEAGRLLCRDPVRLAREARHRQIPSALGPQGLGLPTAWVDAAAGTRPEDPEALREKWLARLAPPSPDAHRAAKPRNALPLEQLLTPDEAQRALCASPSALRRLDEDGVVPSIRVDGERRYDPELVDLLARRANGEVVDGVTRVQRCAEVWAWARFEYWSDERQGRVGDRDPEEGQGEDQGRRASRLIQAEGFETVDDDD